MEGETEMRAIEEKNGNDEKNVSGFGNEEEDGQDSLDLK